MTDYLLLFVGTVLVNNFVLVKFLGLCPFMGVSKKLETAMGMGLATTFVMTLASICAWLIDTWILIPLDLIYLRTLAFILVIAVVVQFTEMVVRKTSPALYRLLGIFLPLITTNCAVLGVALLNINSRSSLSSVGAVRIFRRRRFFISDGSVRRHPRTPCRGGCAPPLFVVTR
ncbi:Electron transport complex protein RnfA [Salmonella enterica subsp. enterica]|uniref:Electron transport complex protein RnfA n=1 Tax=Salmonella enterica I TaxID=59201 RepID=A0A447U3V7_SALET|nr:Electron transport complex protein RnfA [Salmonella enterica subsp. enterica]